MTDLFAAPIGIVLGIICILGLIGGICLLVTPWMRKEKAKFQAQCMRMTPAAKQGYLPEHPTWFQYLPNHTQELALIAIKADPQVFSLTYHRHSGNFREEMLKVHPPLIHRMVVTNVSTPSERTDRRD